MTWHFEMCLYHIAISCWFIFLLYAYVIVPFCLATWLNVTGGSHFGESNRWLSKAEDKTVFESVPCNPLLLPDLVWFYFCMIVNKCTWTENTRWLDRTAFRRGIGKQIQLLRITTSLHIQNGIWKKTDRKCLASWLCRCRFFSLIRLNGLSAITGGGGVQEAIRQLNNPILYDTVQYQLIKWPKGAWACDDAKAVDVVYDRKNQRNWAHELKGHLHIKSETGPLVPLIKKITGHTFIFCVYCMTHFFIKGAIHSGAVCILHKKKHCFQNVFSSFYSWAQRHWQSQSWGCSVNSWQTILCKGECQI